MVRNPLPFLLALAVVISTTYLSHEAAGTEDGDVVVVLMGDIVFNDGLGRITESKGWKYPFEPMMEQIEDADITIANLESPVSIRGTPEKGKSCTFRMDPEDLKGLQYAGIDAVSLSNNHCLDYGPEALNDTLVQLDKVGIGYTGIYFGEDIGNATIPRPLILISEGLRIGFLAYTENIRDHWMAGDNYPGPMPLDRCLMQNDIKTAREIVDILVVSVHWRKWPQYTQAPEPQDIELCHDIVDWGADIIMGHGPHTVHEVEDRNGSLILYSLGNAAMDNGNDTSYYSYIAKVTLTDGRIGSLDLVPIYKKSYRYIPMGTPIERTSDDGLNISYVEVFEMYGKDIYGLYDGEPGRYNISILYALAPWYLKALLLLLLAACATLVGIMVWGMMRKRKSRRVRSISQASP